MPAPVAWTEAAEVMQKAAEVAVDGEQNFQSEKKEQEEEQVVGALWEVVGGADKGGIIVRTGKDPSSPQAPERLSTGSLVRAVEVDGLRLNFVKVSGVGPTEGWATLQLQDKVLLAKVPEDKIAELEKAKEDEEKNEASEEAVRRYSERFGKADQNKGQFNRQCFSWRLDTSLEAVAPPRHETVADLEQDLGLKFGTLSKEAVAEAEKRERSVKPSTHRDVHLTFGYAGSLDRKTPFARFDVRDEVCQRVGGFCHHDVVRDEDKNEFVVIGVKKAEGILRLWFQPLNIERRAAGAFAHSTPSVLRSRFTLVADREHKLEEAKPEDFEAAEDSDGEEMLLCPHCRLPAGQKGYVSKDRSKGLLHGECMAQVMLQELKAQEKFRQEKEMNLKLSRRKQFDIGWSIERIPRNLNPATKLRCSPLPQGMVCLVFNQATRSVRVAATFEPAAALNLEYLSIALQVRRREGREPLFSLDPVDPKEDKLAINFKDEMQVKRYEPEWLKGTSVGEVMFQADYHLKELSMGEYEQPVVGMKSCHDFAEAEGGDKEWQAREWFVVRKAEVQLSEDNVLIPYVKMGVEAREQVMTKHGLDDAKLTRPDHPLVKYAEAFTNNFDLIAERKSVVYHLRELAKASVMAKFLLESGAHLDETWFNLAAPSRDDDKLEIPQLWNERARAEIRVQNGQIVGRDATPRMHGVYGGVQFGLDRFRTTAARPLGRSLQPTLLSGAAPVTGMGRVSAPYFRPSAAGLPGLRPHALVSAPHSLVAPSLGDPRGVDLNLDRFDLTDVTRTNKEKKLGSWAAAEACAAMGEVFWTMLQDETAEKGLFKDEDRKLLHDVFNPIMSDRRREGDLFCPPDTSFAYVTKLRSLVKEEENVRKGRKDLFLSEKFSVAEPGPLFPYSWTNAFAIARGEAKVNPQGGSLHLRPDYKAEAAVFEAVLKSATPDFDKCTEDGLRFRIYRFGSVEVRTTQEHGGEEAIGAVFSIRSSRRVQRGAQTAPTLSGDKVVKVTEYVEKVDVRAVDEISDRRSYAVFETDQGSFVLTEKLNSGAPKWVECPPDLEDRNSLAKVVRTADCNISIRDLRRYQYQEMQRAGPSSSTSEGKRYVQGVYSWAEGGAQGVCSGFGRPIGSGRWRLQQGVPVN